MSAIKKHQQSPKSVSIFEGDVSNEFYVKNAGDLLLSVDIETSGLDFNTDKIGTIQICNSEFEVAIVKISQHRPDNLINLLENHETRKVFHHAIFDIRFVIKKWGVDFCNVACTKIASKIALGDEIEKHSLKNLVRKFYGIDLDKSSNIRKSNWSSSTLDQKQIDYAIHDVIYLGSLLLQLNEIAYRKNRSNLIQSSFDFLPARAQLDLLGLEDVYLY
jgi:ribonuclease D